MRATREWRNWQTRTVEGRVDESPWGFKSPLAHATELVMTARLRGDDGTTTRPEATLATRVVRSPRRPGPDPSDGQP